MEPAGRNPPLSQLDHRVRDVDSRDARAARGRRRGDESGSRTEIEDLRARAHSGGVEERFDRERGEPLQAALVRAGALLPHRTFEPVEVVELVAHVAVAVTPRLWLAVHARSSSTGHELTIF